MGTTAQKHDTLASLRERLSRLDHAHAAGHEATFDPGFPRDDRDAGANDIFSAPLAHAALHEIHAATGADAAAATGFAATLALKAAETDRPIVWARQRYAETEVGHLHAPGLSGMGTDPNRLILLRLRDGEAVVRAGLEAARCSALGAVIIEPWGTPKILDFTATRRLGLAAAQSGVTLFLLRLGTEPAASAARTRWQVAAGPSTPLAANAPGAPVFDITLLRHRAGTPGHSRHLEWDHEHCVFRHPRHLDKPGHAAPLSRPVVSLPQRRSPAPAGEAGNQPANTDSIVRLARAR